MAFNQQSKDYLYNNGHYSGLNLIEGNLCSDICGVQLFCEERILTAPADTAGGEEEPVHEDTRAIILWVIGQ